ncbi:hypothetical protein OG478_52420 [Streptomyces phaeochromogenes]|nr:hypothetical protein OG478_52420 [Streptomyces phaeochromogenes]
MRRDDFNAFYTQEMSAVTVFLMHHGATAYEANAGNNVPTQG